MEDSHLYRMMATSALIGAVISLLKLAGSETKITTKKAIFRALSNSFISLSSCAVLLFVPNVDTMNSEVLLVGVVGLSSLIGSLGTSGLEAVLKSKFN